MSLSEQDVRAIIRDELRRLLGVRQAHDIEFLPTSEAYKVLGYTSQNQLRVAVTNNTLRLGIEVQDRRTPKSAYANYYFNIQACIKRLNTPPERRDAG